MNRELMDFSKLPLGNKNYTVKHDYLKDNYKTKKCIIIDGQNYMLKEGHRIDESDIKDFSCINEYICCQIIDSIGIPVQKTILGTYTEGDDTLVAVACKDFTKENQVFIDFQVIYKDTFVNSDLDFYKRDRSLPHSDLHIEDIIEVIDYQKYIDSKQVKNHYFQMLITDALLNNGDRHNHNWGYIKDNKSGLYELAPIFDCGSGLYSNFSDKIIKRVLSSQELLISLVLRYYGAPLMFREKTINYREFLYTSGIKELEQAIVEIVPRIDLKKINEIIDGTAFISEDRKEFYKTIIAMRKTILLDPAYKRLLEAKHVNN